MKCIKCGSDMVIGFVNTNIELLEHPGETNISFDGISSISPKTVFVCKDCGYLEFNWKNKEKFSK